MLCSSSKTALHLLFHLLHDPLSFNNSNYLFPSNFLSQQKKHEVFPVSSGIPETISWQKTLIAPMFPGAASPDWPGQQVISNRSIMSAYCPTFPQMDNNFVNFCKISVLHKDFRNTVFSNHFSDFLNNEIGHWFQTIGGMTS